MVVCAGDGVLGAECRQIHPLAFSNGWLLPRGGEGLCCSLHSGVPSRQAERPHVTKISHTRLKMRLSHHMAWKTIICKRG